MATSTPKTEAKETTEKKPEAPAGQAIAVAGDAGTTTIADVVIQKISGLATREVPGVHALGGSAARAFGAIRERIPGASASAGQGVAVEVGEKETAVDLQIVVEYGVSIAEVVATVRRSVTDTIEQMTGLTVVEVNITVNDVYIPGDEKQPADEDQ